MYTGSGIYRDSNVIFLICDSICVMTRSYVT